MPDWIFQANLKRYDVHAEVAHPQTWWNTPHHRADIAIDDRVWLQIAGPITPGIHYVATIVSPVYEFAEIEDPRVTGIRQVADEHTIRLPDLSATVQRGATKRPGPPVVPAFPWLSRIKRASAVRCRFEVFEARYPTAGAHRRQRVTCRVKT